MCEAYERDVLPGGDSTFPKFSKRLQRAPEQCIRYRWVTLRVIAIKGSHGMPCRSAAKNHVVMVCAFSAALEAASCGQPQAHRSRRHATPAGRRARSSCRPCRRCMRHCLKA